jgi:hypothetical protein
MNIHKSMASWLTNWGLADQLGPFWVVAEPVVASTVDAA